MFGAAMLFHSHIWLPGWDQNAYLWRERTGGIAGYLDCFPKITGSYAHNVVKEGKVNWSDGSKTLVSTLAISFFFFRVQVIFSFLPSWMACRTCLTIPPFSFHPWQADVLLPLCLVEQPKLGRPQVEPRQFFFWRWADVVTPKKPSQT